jgi:hypothetical protein
MNKQAMRTRGVLIALALAGVRTAHAQNDIENVIVETYYISNATDATPNEGGGTLPEGSRTYRVFLDLCDSCALLSIFGSADHPLDISSTAPFYNNPDRGKTYGHEVNNGALDENTVALDSWLSLGGASTQRFGVLKAEDPDSTSEELFPNDLDMLANEDPGAGIPLSVADGLFLDTIGSQPPSFFTFGITPDSAFHDSTQAGSFVSDSTRISCQLPGMRGHGIGNKMLIAQLTTTGELTFCINVEIVRVDGSVVRYVSSDTLLATDEAPSGLLCYPPVCGCTDPDFLEYDPTAGCDDGSCATAIVFGCLDTNACNYDPTANFNFPALCCYGPDSCNGLDVTVVCPGVGMNEDPSGSSSVTVYPNPVHERLNILVGDALRADANCYLLDRSGRLVRHFHMGDGHSGATSIDVSDIAPGLYLLRVVTPVTQDVLIITKN